MADITPITEEEFMKLASEEGVPLSLAATLYGIESSAGTAKSAYVDPRAKAGKGAYADTPADKIGYGSLQMTAQNAEKYMPGIDFYSATDEQLTRGALKLIKANMNADGTYDKQRIKRAFFGAGVDKSMAAARNQPGYSPATDPSIAEKFDRGLWNMDNQWIEGQSIRDTLGLTIPDGVDVAAYKGANVNTQVAQLNSDAEKTFKYDPAAAEAKYNAAKDLQTAALRSILDKSIERNNIALEAAGMNPYGTYTEALATMDALKAANARLRQTVSDINFQTKPVHDGLAGVLETFIRKVGGDANYASQVKEVNDLQKAASDFQTVLQGMQINAARGQESLTDAINIATAGRAAGEEAIKFDAEALKVDRYNEGVRLRNAQQASLDQNRAAQQENARLRTELTQARDEANTRIKEARFEESIRQYDQNYELNVQKFMTSEKTAQARAEFMTQQIEISRRRVAAKEQLVAIAQKRYDDTKSPDSYEALRRANLALKNAKLGAELIGATGTDDVDVISAAANTIMNTPGKVWDRKELNDRIKSDPEIGKKINQVIMAGGDATKMRDPDVLANLNKLVATGSPYEREASAKLIAEITSAANVAFSSMAGKNAAMLTDKQRAAFQAAAAAQAKNVVAGAPTNEINFSANPVNVMPMGDYIKIAGAKGGLLKTMESAGIDPANIKGDAQLVSELLYAQRRGKITESPAALRDQLLSYYQELAVARSGKGDSTSVIYKANIPVPSDQYIIKTTANKQYDLSKSSGLLTYMQDVLRKSRSPGFTTEEVTGRDIWNLFTQSRADNYLAGVQANMFQELQK